MGNQAAALGNFEKAYNLHPDNPRIFYNYGLLLQQTGNSLKAIKVLEAGLAVDPNSSVLNYAMAYVYLQNKQIPKARQYGIILKRLDPGNPDYQQLFSVLGVE
jgi:tetratricopeptide (TPR) repeat protein